jgi:hypothetical protein
MIETLPFQGFVRTPYAKSVESSGPSFWKVAMPDQIRLLPHRDAMNLTASRLVEEAERNGFGMLREKCEVHAFSVPRGA